MAFKQLGIVEITAGIIGANQTLYTVPASKQTIISTILAVNKNTASAAEITMYHVASGDAAGTDNQLPRIELTTAPVAGSGSQTYTAFTLGISMATGDTIVVKSDVADVNFIAWGDELDA